MKHNIIFLNNKAMEEAGVLDMHAAIEDVKKCIHSKPKARCNQSGKMCTALGKNC